MTTIYIPYASGPWSADDDWVHADGVKVNGTEHNQGIVTCDGSNAARRPDWSVRDEDLTYGRTLRHKDNP